MTAFCFIFLLAIWHILQRLGLQVVPLGSRALASQMCIVPTHLSLYFIYLFILLLSFFFGSMSITFRFLLWDQCIELTLKKKNSDLRLDPSCHKSQGRWQVVKNTHQCPTRSKEEKFHSLIPSMPLRVSSLFPLFSQILYSITNHEAIVQCPIIMILAIIRSCWEGP